MRQLIVRQLGYDLTPVAGLALVGHYLRSVRPVLDRLDAALLVRGGVSTADVCRAYLGLLVQGKSDFDATRNFRGDAFFKQALGIGLLASSPTLRQRLDAKAVEMFDFVPPMIETLLACNRVGLPAVDWLIKWNPRSTEVHALGDKLAAQASTVWQHPRQGKRVTTWQKPLRIEGIERPLRGILRLTERTIDARGQALIEPQLTLDGWTTSLAQAFSADDVIALYADHGTHEQFHAEVKTDLDLTRLPSGKPRSPTTSCASWQRWR